MRGMLRGLLGAIGVATLMMWSAGASAHKTTSEPAHADCEGTTCYYGAICPDGWGGCYWYEWKIGSAVNSYEEKAGIANVVKLCDPSTLTNCVYVTSSITLTQDPDGHPNALITCRVPGADTCTDAFCGGSPDASSWIFAQQAYAQVETSTLDSSGCTKDDSDKRGIKCKKTNTLNGPDNLAAQFCPNGNWNAHWIPIDFEGETMVQGPKSKRDPSVITTFAKAHCWLLDPNGNKSSDPDYALSADPTQNTLYCEPRGEGTY